jgi:hypothetical protein
MFPIVSSSQKTHVGAMEHSEDYVLFKFRLGDHVKKFKDYYSADNAKNPQKVCKKSVFVGN